MEKRYTRIELFHFFLRLFVWCWVILPIQSLSPELASFESWFQQIGGIANGVALYEFDDQFGTGLKCMKNISEKELVLSVPMSFVILRDTILSNLPTNVEKKMAKLQDEDALLSLFLMYHSSLKSNSKWYPYIKSLPSTVDRTIFFSNQELKALQDELEMSYALQKRSFLEQQYQELLPLIKQLFHNQSIENITHYGSQEVYLWANSIVSSRALTLQGKKFLIPYADMVNYQPHHLERPNEAGNHFLEYHKKEKDHFLIYTDRECLQGKQFYEDYGDNNNYIYLRHHGFVVEDNPFDCVHLTLPKLSGSSELIKQKHQLLQKIGINTPLSWTSCVPPKLSQLPLDIELYFQVDYMNEDKIMQCLQHLSTKQQQLQKYCFQYSIHGHQLLKSHLLVLIKEFPTTIQEDQNLLALSKENNTLSSRERLAIVFRKTRKQLLIQLIKEIIQEEKKKKILDLETKAAKFNEWLENHKDIDTNHLRVQVFDGMRFGVITKKTITQGEKYLALPLSVVLNQESARKCSILGKLFADLTLQFGEEDPLLELLLHFLYEKFVKKENSLWKEYLDILPEPSEMDSSLFFDDHDLHLLNGTEILTGINVYQHTTQKSFHAVNTLILSKYPHIFPKEIFNFQNYQYGYAILDSRTIRWNGKRHLAPFLDMVNCEEAPDPTRIHQTIVDPTGKLAINHASWTFGPDEQIFENCGQPNYIYLQYHGFVLEKNSHDCLLFSVSINMLQYTPDSFEEISGYLKEAGFHSPRLEMCFQPKSIPSQLIQFIQIIFQLNSNKDDDKWKEYLFQIANIKFSFYPKLIQQDGIEETYRRKMILLYMSQQKKLLQELIDFLSKKDTKQHDTYHIEL